MGPCSDTKEKMEKHLALRLLPRYVLLFGGVLIFGSLHTLTGALQQSSPDGTDPCCSMLRTQYSRDYIYQLTSLTLKDFRDIDFRCRQHICALDRSTRYGILYFGGEGMASVNIYSCNKQSDRLGGDTGTFSPSTKHVLAGPCLCLNIEIIGRNVSRFSYSLQQNNSSLVAQASFYIGETSRATNRSNGSGSGRNRENNQVDVAYTCSSFTPSIQHAGPNTTVQSSIKTDSSNETVVHSTDYPLNSMDSDSEDSNVTGRDEVTTAMSSTDTAEGSSNEGKTTLCPGNTQRTGITASFSNSRIHASDDDANHNGITGWIVAVGMCGIVILCLMIFVACLLAHHFKNDARLVKRPFAVIPAPATEQAGAYQARAYQNDVFSPEVAHDQQEHHDVRTINVMTTFGGSQSASCPEIAVSQLAPSEMYALDISHHGQSAQRQHKDTTHVSSSPECLELDGSDFSDDDFFCDDFDDFCLNETVI